MLPARWPPFRQISGLLDLCVRIKGEEITVWGKILRTY